MKPERDDGLGLIQSWATRTFASLAVPDFRNLWVGSFATQIGMWTQHVAQGWLAYDLTGSATFLGAVALARAGPSLVLTLPSGVLADRWNRRQIVVVSQGLSMLNALTLALLVITGLVQPWHLIASGFVLGTTHSFNMPARQSLVAQLAGPTYTANAVALNAISFNTARVLGPALAGVLIGFWGLAACFLVQAGSLLWGMIWTLAISDAAEVPAGRQRGSIWRNLVDGLRFTKDSRAISGLITIAAVPILFGMIYMQLMPVFAKDVLEVGPSGLGLLMSAVGAGSMAGAFVAAAVSHHPRKGIILLVSTAGLGGSIALFASSQLLVLALIALTLVGVTQAISMAMNQTLLNLLTPNEYRGRMNSIYMMTWNIEPLVFVPAGWLTDQAGAPFTTLLAGGLVIASVLVIGAREREIREFEDGDVALPSPDEKRVLVPSGG